MAAQSDPFASIIDLLMDSTGQTSDGIIDAIARVEGLTHAQELQLVDEIVASLSRSLRRLAQSPSAQIRARNMEALTALASAPRQGNETEGANDFMRIEEVAEMTRVSAATLRFWRAEGKGQGPKSGKFGRRVVYRRGDVQEWINEQFNQ